MNAGASMLGYDFQTNALLPYMLFSLGYLGILFCAKDKRDSLGFFLVGLFCIVLGLRDVAGMPVGADPVLYATILSNASGAENLLGGIDYALLIVLRGVTGAFFGLSGCFLILHLLYLPVIYLLFRYCRRVKGMFFLMAGWMLFVNSGVLLLANFFRQGISVFLFLAVLVGFSVPDGSKWVKRLGALTLPLFHMAGAVLIPSLFLQRKRYYYYLFPLLFLAFCLAIHLGLGNVTVSFADYFDVVDQGALKDQLWTKIVMAYAILLVGYCLQLRIDGHRVQLPARNPSVESRILQRTAIGVILPTAALLLTSNAPIIGLRYLYYSHAVAFLYLACCLCSKNREALFKASSIGLCAFGFVTWTYPTVACLLVW
jgi:hypothetical protein